jgi:hypothetical protein
VTLRELHELIAASSPSHWRTLPLVTDEDDAEQGPDHTHRAVLRADVDLVLTWGLRESSRDYFEPWLGNLGRMTEVRADRVVLDVLWRGSLVDRLLGLAFAEWLLPFPRSRQPRVKGLPDRYFDRDEATPWRLAHELSFPDGIAFERVVHRSGLRVE